jgi:hypothetical protein
LKEVLRLVFEARPAVSLQELDSQEKSDTLERAVFHFGGAAGSGGIKSNNGSRRNWLLGLKTGTCGRDILQCGPVFEFFSGFVSPIDPDQIRTEVPVFVARISLHDGFIGRPIQMFRPRNTLILWRLFTINGA